MDGNTNGKRAGDIDGDTDGDRTGDIVDGIEGEIEGEIVDDGVGSRVGDFVGAVGFAASGCAGALSFLRQNVQQSSGQLTPPFSVLQSVTNIVNSRFRRKHTSGGAAPVKRLPSTLSFSKVVMLPSCVGIVPLKKQSLRINCAKRRYPSSVGIVPIRSLSFIDKTSKLVMLPNSVMIVPVDKQA